MSGQGETVAIMNRITPLSPEAIAHIQSSKEIISLSDVVAALIENSLDAAATRIDITVDFSRASCTVGDNGHGILPVEFAESGGLGKAFHTSKVHELDSRDLHGGTGSFLASLSASALLKITSCHHSLGGPNTIIFHNGKVMSRQIQSQEVYDQTAVPPQGTQVDVHDLFGNMPVRVKQRATETAGRHQTERLWTGVKRVVAALLLAWPRPCTVKLSSPAGPDGKLRTVSFHSGSTSSLTERNLNQFEGKPDRNDPRDALHMLYEARLAIGDTRFEWVPLVATTSTISVRGAICRQPVPTRQCQFLSIGVHPCPPSGMHDELYEAVNAAFVDSSFTVVEDKVDVSELLNKYSKHDIWKQSGVRPVKNSARKRSLDRWPMFVLQIRLNGESQHRQVAAKLSNADLGFLVEMLNAAVSQWLAANQFQPHRRKRRKLADHQAIATRPDNCRRSLPDPLLLSPVKESFGPSIRRSPCGTGLAKSVTENAQKVSSMAQTVSRSTGDLSIRPFSAWSRIKSSRSTKNDVDTTKRPSTMPCGISVSEHSKQVSFNVPTLELGNIDSYKPENHVHRKALSNEEISFQHTGAVDTVSSDDHGTIDEAAMCAMVRPSDRGCDQTFTVNGQADVDANSSSRQQCSGREEDTLDWADPTTGEICKISQRTGMVLPMRPQSIDTSARYAAAIDTSLTSTRRRIQRSLGQSVPMRDGVQKMAWLPEFLQQWENPVFQRRVEAPIPVVAVHELLADSTKSLGVRPVADSCGVRSVDHRFKSSKQLSKNALKGMEVISQVDRKFILCKLTQKPSKSRTTSLVMVDQHAASERVILESLFTELCTPVDPSTPAGSLVTNLGHRSAVTTILLDKHIQFEISETEYDLSVRHGPFLASWGILYDAICYTHKSDQNRGKSVEYRIVVKALPSGIRNRCALTPSLLIELLRSELWKSSEYTQSLTTVSLTPEETKMGALRWIKRLGSCPKGIIEMLNSRACRSAIMFNDPLELHQCQKLIQELGTCAFPFVCAHGRISMVPLVDVGGKSGLVSEENAECLDECEAISAEPECFSRAFKHWQNII